ncbi:MAG: xanthine dehydrogenase family protein molybdopterin-binding subunit [Candidatus Dormibacter sp.]|uniref:xanthine dehydrogenase family protein molybdopterin-binding subunit n=1 Tax=Candidatus Dormibacter sp. TaxID=2973982 RepID=UPI003D9BE9C9
MAIGQPLRRREDPSLVRGQGRYASDPAPARTVHLAIRRAGLAAGKGLRVDVGPALSAPGVVGAWAAGQLGLADERMPRSPGRPEGAIGRPVLAVGSTRFEGEAIAVVAAESEYQAHDALDLLQVDLEPGQPDLSVYRRDRHSYEDAAAALEQAEIRQRHRLRMGRICGAAMEPRAVLADWREDEARLVIRASVGWVHGLRDVVASCLGLEPAQVVALTDDVGGSFGAKNHPYPEYVVAAAVSRLLRRPARWTASRIEDGLTTGQSHDADLDVELAADSEGRLLAVRVAIDWPVGAYGTFGANQDLHMAHHAMSGYRLPALEVEVTGRYSNSPPATHIRGGGRPVGNFAIERAMDRLARRLGIEPVEVRRRNLIPPSEMPYATGFRGVTYDGGDYPAQLAAVAERIGVGAIRERQRRGEPVGLGVAFCVEATGIGQPEPSRVIVLPDGTARVLAGGTPQGQGHQTFIAQVVAERLQWPLDRISVWTGDSRAVPFSSVTAASRTALEVGNSVALSAASARRALVQRASELLEADAEDLVITPKQIAVRGVPSRALPLAAVVGDGLEAAETWDSRGAAAWSSSCHAAVVRIDPETGGVQMLRYVIAHDSGRSINPTIVAGQLHGGYAHGLGYALFEEALYSEEGSFLTPSFLDYTLVSAPELTCEPEIIHFESTSSQNPESFRGVGEAGTIAVPAAIANAVEDALYAIGRPVEIAEVPITPERLWAAVNRSQVPTQGMATGAGGVDVGARLIGHASSPGMSRQPLPGTGV